jgi:nucleotide-binding universal stress UspA family protein
VNIRTILVPVDFSACSLSLVRRAGSLAGRLEARVVLHHVASLPASLPPGAHLWPGGVETSSASGYVVDDVREHLVPLVRAAEEAGAPAVEAVVDTGDVVAAIIAATERLGADLIVMSTHGRAGLARVVLGSVAEGVAHRAQVPVMLVRREPSPECGTERCDWCAEDGRSPAERQAAAETEG